LPFFSPAEKWIIIFTCGYSSESLRGIRIPTVAFVALGLAALALMGVYALALRQL